MRIGIDIGSTTAKVVVLDEQNHTVWQIYRRHMSQVRETAAGLLRELLPFCGGRRVRAAVTGSAGLGLAKESGLPFVQEVFAVAGAVERFMPDTDAAVELGGEDAKILFFTGGLEERMNGSCAGGTGAFIDQMATLLNVTVEELDALSRGHQKIYHIASRCGVFAKTDIQPLLNQGARKEDIAASIYQAVVSQTIAGLAQGREIKGKVLFLGGPLFFLKGLRERFTDTLKLTPENAVFPDNADVFVAVGAALYAGDSSPEMPFAEILRRVEQATARKNITNTLPPLFAEKAAYAAFSARHSAACPPAVDADNYTGDAWLGIDAGSTTTKLVLIDANGGLLHTWYASNAGNPVAVVREQLLEIYRRFGGRVTIRGSAATGYGEELIQNAFAVDMGLVETVAHHRAARHFSPEVDFVIDIGGQDMKCFKVHSRGGGNGGAIDNILLNEACSSGCGSFIETFARALGEDVAAFSRRGLFAAGPVDLGSRCTVFMNSSVKQAQKEGASVDDISAGLSVSVVKNAVYKVIRASGPAELGSHIVVQGGTFLNDAVLRAFELELGTEVVRPTIAGVMGAYGAALAARDAVVSDLRPRDIANEHISPLTTRHSPLATTILSAAELENFVHTAKTVNCGLCGNHCLLTVNSFGGGRQFISGNRCERPVSGRQNSEGNKSASVTPDSSPLTPNSQNLFAWKYDYLRSLSGGDNIRGKIGIPMGLNLYENLPFWHAFFTCLGFEVLLSPASNRALYHAGQHTIPSDTVCYPAKLLHGHIEKLLDTDADVIFYPCLPYNFDEGKGDNHYNCPVVAYYPELLNANVGRLGESGAPSGKPRFLFPYFGLHRPGGFAVKAAEYFGSAFGIPAGEIKKAARAAYAAQQRYMAAIREKGAEIIADARKNGRRIVVLAGRPYHMDPEIHHGIDGLISRFGLAVLTEDAVAHLAPKQPVRVLNQWTYHSRLYHAAAYVTTQPDMELVQLVSFGCGIDAITTDEVRAILEQGGKLYTQLKIDEINNLGAVKIRIRSLLAAVDARACACELKMDN